MLQFSANISTLFRELPLFDRIELAAKVGFDAIEIQFPYDQDASELKAVLDANGMPLALMNFPAGDLVTGGPGISATAGREAEFEQALETARHFAEILKPRSMNLLAGRIQGATRDTAMAVFISRLHKAHALTQALGVKLVTEPFNTFDWPGFLLLGSEQGMELLDQLDEPTIKLQYDFYHMVLMDENLLSRIPQIIDSIGHFQFADVPGRGEPGSGELDFVELFELINQLDYDGYIGAEYFSDLPARDSVDWLRMIKP